MPEFARYIIASLAGICVFSFVASTKATAQIQTPESAAYRDSLLSVLKTQQGRARLETRYRLARYLVFHDTAVWSSRKARAFLMCDSVAKAAARQNYPWAEARALALTGQAYGDDRQFERGLQYADQAISVARKADLQRDLPMFLLNKANLLRNMAPARLEECERLARRAESIARETRNDSALGAALIALGDYLRDMNRPGEALEVFHEALGIYDLRAETYWKGVVARKLSQVYSQTGDRQNYRKYVEMFFRISESRNTAPADMAGPWLEAGNLFRINGDYNRALKYYFKSLAPLEENLSRCPDVTEHNCRQGFIDLGVVRFNAAISYELAGQPDSARLYYERGIEMFRKLGRTETVVFGKLRVLRTLIDEGKLDEAGALADSLGSLGNLLTSASANVLELETGMLAFAQNDFRAAKRRILRALKKKLGNRLFEYDSLADFSQVEAERRFLGALERSYLALGKPDSALLALRVKSMYEQQELLRKIESREADLLNAFDLRGKTREITDLQARKAVSQKQLGRQRAFIWGISAGAVIVLAMLLITFRNYRQKAALNTLLAEQKAEIAAAFEEINSVNANLKEALVKIEKQNLDMKDGLNYARRIQQAVLPRREYLANCFSDFMLYYRPRDVISGDFYWLGERDGLRLLAVCDCTGRGVAAGLMTVLASGSLHRSVSHYGITDPGVVLSELNRRLNAALAHQEDSVVAEGVRVAFCAVDVERRELHFAGANRPAWLVRGEEIVELEGERAAAGRGDAALFYDTTVAPYQPGDRLYLFTNGLTGQFGGAQGLKFRKKGLRKFIRRHAERSLKEQGKIFTQEFGRWSGARAQLDDITLLAVQLD